MATKYDRSAADVDALNHTAVTDPDQTVREVAGLPVEAREWEAWRNAESGNNQIT